MFYRVNKIDMGNIGYVCCSLPVTKIFQSFSIFQNLIPVLQGLIMTFYLSKNFPVINVYFMWFLGVDFDECNSQPCQNNAQCYNQPGRFQCVCRAGFYGPMCENGKLIDKSGPIFMALLSAYRSRQFFTYIKHISLARLQTQTYEINL